MHALQARTPRIRCDRALRAEMVRRGQSTASLSCGRTPRRFLPTCVPAHKQVNNTVLPRRPNFLWGAAVRCAHGGMYHACSSNYLTV